MVSIKSLSFGTVCGICAGVFIKKGLRLVAFLLGGTFVLLQYMNANRLVSVNWSALANRYDRAVGSDRSVTGVWNGLIHFLTADFQPRATFVAGLLLGFRLG